MTRAELERESVYKRQVKVFEDIPKAINNLTKEIRLQRIAVESLAESIKSLAEQAKKEEQES